VFSDKVVTEEAVVGVVEGAVVVEEETENWLVEDSSVVVGEDEAETEM